MYGKLTDTYLEFDKKFGFNFASATTDDARDTIGRDLPRARAIFAQDRISVFNRFLQAGSSGANVSYTQGNLTGEVFNAVLCTMYRMNLKQEGLETNNVEISFGYINDQNILCAASIYYIPGCPQFWLATIINDVFAPPAERRTEMFGSMEVMNANSENSGKPVFPEVCNNIENAFLNALGSREISTLLSGILDANQHVNESKLRAVKNRLMLESSVRAGIDDRERKLELLVEMRQLLQNPIEQKKMDYIISRAKNDIHYFQNIDEDTLVACKEAITASPDLPDSSRLDFLPGLLEYIALYHHKNCSTDAKIRLVKALTANLLTDSSDNKEEAKALQDLLDEPQNKALKDEITLYMANLYQDCYKTPQNAFAQDCVKKIENLLWWHCDSDSSTIKDKLSAGEEITEKDFSLLVQDISPGSAACELREYISQANAIHRAQAADALVSEKTHPDPLDRYRSKIDAITRSLEMSRTSNGNTARDIDIIARDNSSLAKQVLQGFGILLLACTIIPIGLFIAMGYESWKTKGTWNFLANDAKTLEQRIKGMHNPVLKDNNTWKKELDKIRENEGIHAEETPVIRVS